MRPKSLIAAGVLVMLPCPLLAQAGSKPRARELGIAPGTLRPGVRNAITDVPGVRVGQTTLVRGDSIRTGVTAILPHGGNLYRQRVPAAIVVGNGFGKLVGVTQVEELGELESPILLTCTLCVWRAADAVVEWMLGQPGMESVRSLNPVVGETNDGFLNAIRTRPVTAADVRHALESADTGAVAEGSVGAGTGTTAFGWKGGIGTASRALPDSLGGWRVGVLLQSNYGGDLHILGTPVGRELGTYGVHPGGDARQGKGSCMIVVATDAPLSDRNLKRLAARALLGLGRTGSFEANGSGDYVIAFSTNLAVRRPSDSLRVAPEIGNDQMTPLFQGVVEATEEAVYNSLFAATTVKGSGNTVEAIPTDRVLAILKRHGVIP